MSGPRFSRPIRRFLYITAHVAVLVYVLQVFAVDHWRASPADVMGLEGTQAHVVHCHGGGDCADSGAASLAGSVDHAVLAPAAPDAHRATPVTTSATTAEPYLALPHQPPQT